MTKRALLIGRQTFGLTGVNGDVELMVEALTGRGFNVSVLVDDAATRAAILDAYEHLIDKTPRGSTDPVVVYYSGHGGRDAFDDSEELQQRGERSHVQYIVPFDMAATTESDFRGILAEELSALQTRLTERTANVTTILDCCHSATMSRDVSMVPKAVPRNFPVKGAPRLLERLDGLTTNDDWDGSNRLAVRVVACDPTQSAYERASVLGGQHGALTEQLVIALDDLRDRAVSWRWVGDRIRTRVSAEIPVQRPEVEGPVERVPFSLVRRPMSGAVPVNGIGGELAIEPARIFGVSAGDLYLLMDENESEVARANVANVVDDRARLETDPPLPSNPPSALMAVPVRTASTRPVRLGVTTAIAKRLTPKVEASPILRVAEVHARPNDEKSVAEPPAVTIVGDEVLTVLDGTGLQINRDTLPTDDAGLDRAIAAAERVVRAERLRRLRSGVGDGSRERLVRVEFFSHDPGGPSPRNGNGERMHVGEKISVRITNTTDAPLYIGLFDIDLASCITLLNRAEPAGWRIEPGETRQVGGTDGVSLSWDETAPDDEERLETLVIIAATKPQEFRILETARAAGTRGIKPSSELESLLSEAGTGMRKWPLHPSTDGTASRYSVETIDFYLSPIEKADVSEPTFAITELPSLSERTMLPRRPIDTPQRAAVRLIALKIRNNKALFRAAVRLDALVLTGAADGKVIAQPFTFRFPGIQDGDLLPMDNLQIYHGDVNDFLDIAIWVNRDDAKGVDLAKLFEGAANDPTTYGALTVLGGLVIAAPQIALAVGAVAAVATVIRVGSELVHAAVGKEFGLYRTSFLAFERYGVGRQPAEGLREAQGIEFAYEIIDVSGEDGGTRVQGAQP
jgi:hypothetical protein